jgi:hypothetical protein
MKFLSFTVFDTYLVFLTTGFFTRNIISSRVDWFQAVKKDEEIHFDLSAERKNKRDSVKFGMEIANRHGRCV